MVIASLLAHRSSSLKRCSVSVCVSAPAARPSGWALRFVPYHRHRLRSLMLPPPAGHALPLLSRGRARELINAALRLAPLQDSRPGCACVVLAPAVPTATAFSMQRHPASPGRAVVLRIEPLMRLAPPASIADAFAHVRAARFACQSGNGVCGGGLPCCSLHRITPFSSSRSARPALRLCACVLAAVFEP